ncbi:nitrate reductase [Pleomorphomonas sp. NRK KF1]|uniref:nitrate reductase n=1 Tax=Pleomorphomonas sp. NRK KF1 TaxID=2943000 RepID=UPI0020435F31|nr:nitrate reductase [Pleomorphomonas sp. NRK KF1]MCM5552977.1 nitrate reductase [Pleomorphomonas sp. NRK KF1]
MSFLNPFAPRRPRAAASASGQLKVLVRDTVGFDDDVSIAVSEVACRHSDCEGAETLVLIDVTAGDLRVLRFAKPAADVSADDIRAAVAGGRSGSQMES